MPETTDYLDQTKARVEIDRQLADAGWAVQRHKHMNLGAARGVAVREFPMAAGHGDADYLLFVDRNAVGVIEAKKAGSTLTSLEWQSAKYTAGLPDDVPALTRPLAFSYESTGVETRFTNGFDPEPASRQVFTFHRPETLAESVRAWCEWGGVERATFRQRPHDLPPLDPVGLWPAQEADICNLEVSLAHFRPRALIQMARRSTVSATGIMREYRGSGNKGKVGEGDVLHGSLGRSCVGAAAPGCDPRSSQASPGTPCSAVRFCGAWRRPA